MPDLHNLPRLPPFSLSTSNLSLSVPAHPGPPGQQQHHSCMMRKEREQDPGYGRAVRRWLFGYKYLLVCRVVTESGSLGLLMCCVVLVVSLSGSFQLQGIWARRLNETRGLQESTAALRHALQSGLFPEISQMLCMRQHKHLKSLAPDIFQNFSCFP